MQAQTSSLKEISEKKHRSHWDQVYNKAEVHQLGWYEKYPEPSLQLIRECNVDKNASLLHVGAGATTLVDELLSIGFQNLLVNDISAQALEKLKHRLGEKRESIQWILDDLTRPTQLNNLDPVDVWHDRAVLHFFIEQEEQDTYFNLLKKLVKPGGFVILATFNLNGATKCSGLPVHRYDQHMLAEKLGSEFELLKAFDYIYTMPAGDTREYIYTLFRRE